MSPLWIALLKFHIVQKSAFVFDFFRFFGGKNLQRDFFCQFPFIESIYAASFHFVKNKKCLVLHIVLECQSEELDSFGVGWRL